MDCSSLVTRAMEKCFNQEGDLQLVVVSNGSAKAEFRVYSAFLSAWSPALAEQVMQGLRWEVPNFSVAAVEGFLRFLYSGRMPSNLVVATESSLMAERYGVLECSQVCEDLLQNGAATPRDVYAMLEVAHRFPDVGNSLRSACLHALLADPEQSLREAWTLNSRLLEELLPLASNDIGDFELAKMIISWQEQNPHQNFADLLQEHVTFGGFNEERFQEIRYHAESVGLAFVVDQMWAQAQASAGQWTPDIFKYLESKWQVQCEEHRRHMPFLGCWLNLIPSSLGWRPPYHPHGPHRGQEEVARNVLKLELQPGESMTWFLPIHSIHVSGINFSEPVASVHEGSACVEIFSSLNGCTWELLWSSARSNLSCRTKERVRWFKLSAKSIPFVSQVQIQGVVHAG
ncbi:unnamed protein product [Effrenium voratum]|uniref:BTB domain-containing protein n=1 Tax=Effrenium voratum TaxID=2562239 RepID=A0AA36MUH6_9DINO|nr:unnamed protein product [Effrenium voratum]CAJ1380401.1 unnamed protein product [Effrenium voratum]CAJ1450374.1 unnamed protein product [Effrenium voratum]